MIHTLHLSFFPRKPKRRKKKEFLQKTSFFILFRRGGFILRRFVSNVKRFSFLSRSLPQSDKGGPFCFSDEWLTEVKAFAPASSACSAFSFPLLFNHTYTSSSSYPLLHAHHLHSEFGNYTTKVTCGDTAWTSLLQMQSL